MKQYDEKIILYFAMFHRTVDLMKATGLSKNTICKYKKNKEFMELAKQRRDELLQSAVHRMECELFNTINVLCKIRDKESINPQTRVSACNTILNHFQSLKVTLEFSERLEALERMGESEDG